VRKVFIALVLRFAFPIAVRNVRACAIRRREGLLSEEGLRLRLRFRKRVRVCLLFCVVDLDPVAIGVFEIYLFDAIYPELYRPGLAGPVFVGNVGRV
jgi:hypothetical protein